MTRETTIVTPENVEIRFELAGLGSRFAAMVLDMLLLALALVVLGLVAMGLTVGFSLASIKSPPTWVWAIGILLLFSLWNGYFLFFEATRNGQTPGKKSVGIRVVLDTGHPVDFRAALLRNVMRIVDGLPGMIYGIGFVSIFLSPQYRRLGDYAAGTLVVKTRRRPEKAEAAPVPQPAAEEQQVTPEQDQPAFLLPPEALPYLHEITRDDYRTVRHFLNRRRELEESIALELAKRLAVPLAAKLRLDMETIEDPMAFLDNLGREWERRMIH